MIISMGDSIKVVEARLTEIAVLKTHIINYAKTREVYNAYRKSGYSKKFLETHREEITLHKAAKAAFDEAGLQKLPKVKELDAEFAELLTQKKAAYPDYRKARDEMQELVRAQNRRTSRLDKSRLPGTDREWSVSGIFCFFAIYRQQCYLTTVYQVRRSRYSIECNQPY